MTTIEVENVNVNVKAGVVNNNQNNEQQQQQNGTTTPPTTGSTGWVHFEEDTTSPVTSPAVISTESVQVNLERSNSNNNAVSAVSDGNLGTLDPKPLRNVTLQVETVRQGFSNGDVIVTLLPVNTRWPWITPAQFRPELVPEELMAQGLTLTVEEYVQAMELLVNDVRFTLYNICYKRVLVVWIALAFTVLLGLLFSGLTGLTLFALGVGWLILNASAIFLSMWIKFRLSRGLERCLADVNKHLLRHKIVLALDDRGKISCHKVNLCFVYMDPAQCIAQLQTSIDQQERDPGAGSNWEQRMDITVNDIVIQGSRTTRLSRKQERSALLYLRYAARWGRDLVRGKLSSPVTPGRHCSGGATCPCQFIEEHLHCKPGGKLTIAALCHIPDVQQYQQNSSSSTSNATTTHNNNNNNIHANQRCTIL